MESFVWFFFSGFAVILCIHSASAIQCYNCNSHVDKQCGFHGEVLNKKFLIECDSNATLCRKIDQNIPFKENDMGPDERVIRECGHDQSNEKAYYFTSGLGGQQYVYGCDKDGCNSASALNYNLKLASSTLILFVILHLCY